MFQRNAVVCDANYDEGGANEQKRLFITEWRNHNRETVLSLDRK